MNKEISLRVKSWGYVGGFTLLIYSTLYIVRPVVTFLRQNIPFFDTLGNILVVVIAVLIVLALYRFKALGMIRKKTVFFLLVTTVLVYTAIIWRVEFTEEKIHFFEYGLLSWLIYKAFLVDIKGLPVFLYSLTLVFIIGWGDEIIQYLLPNRYYDIRDVIMNGTGGLMGLILIFIARLDTKRELL